MRSQRAHSKGNYSPENSQQQPAHSPLLRVKPQRTSFLLESTSPKSRAVHDQNFVLPQMASYGSMAFFSDLSRAVLVTGYDVIDVWFNDFPEVVELLHRTID